MTLNLCSQLFFQVYRTAAHQTITSVRRGVLCFCGRAGNVLCGQVISPRFSLSHAKQLFPSQTNETYQFSPVPSAASTAAQCLGGTGQQSLGVARPPSCCRRHWLQHLHVNSDYHFVQHSETQFTVSLVFLIVLNLFKFYAIELGSSNHLVHASRGKPTETYFRADIIRQPRTRNAM